MQPGHVEATDHVEFTSNKPLRERLWQTLGGVGSGEGDNLNDVRRALTTTEAAVHGMTARVEGCDLRSPGSRGGPAQRPETSGLAGAEAATVGLRRRR